MSDRTGELISYGICLYAMIPVRIEPSHRSELCNQLLFGETYIIHEAKDDWVKITGSFDNYRGWIDNNQVAIINKKAILDARKKLT